MTVFTDLVAARDLTLTDPSLWTTPSEHALPNGDAGTRMNNATSFGMSAIYNDTPRFFSIPWGVSDWTIELWLRRVSAATIRDLMQYADAGGDTGMEWRIETGNTLYRLLVYNSSGTVSVASVPITSTDGAWAQYVWMINSSLGTGAESTRRVRTYKNGSFVADTAFTASFTPHTNVSPPRMILGTYGLVDATQELAKVAIYHGELSAADVLDHYAAMTT